MIEKEPTKEKRINNLYVYIGTFREGLKEKDVQEVDEEELCLDDARAEYRKYLNFACNDDNAIQVKQIPISKCDKFEKDNIVLYPSPNMDQYLYYRWTKDRYREDVEKYGEEKALEKIMYKKKRQESSMRNKK